VEVNLENYLFFGGRSAELHEDFSRLEGDGFSVSPSEKNPGPYWAALRRVDVGHLFP
jgi:hypothetical protein